MGKPKSDERRQWELGLRDTLRNSHEKIGQCCAGFERKAVLRDYVSENYPGERASRYLPHFSKRCEKWAPRFFYLLADAEFSNDKL